MTILLARLKHAARWAWALLVPVAVVLGYIFGRRGRQDLAVDPFADAVERARHTRQLADARLVVEIAAARAEKGKDRDELLAALADPDEERGAQRLIEQAARLRGE